ncbi:hypothetical protein DOTSEDRAFT_134265 [Dothistroma septosporum NZE10]|uniref:Uncharacterized protein n=1 Tax=Dothistroma septosporum (strain NZE10 / CBS 128990) TaxID=675120 RepID=N1PKG3_DOTSN|nr:hypothetical protein DOTSEDRAFT_134265 [Dothistroma septosporum NZE10]
MAKTECSQESSRRTETAQKRRPTPVSEKMFLSIAGLNPDSEQEHRLYLLMKIEALHAVQDLNSRPVEESRLRQAMSMLYQSASPETRRVYNLYGDAVSASPGDNWIIRWLMWQALAQI